MFSFSDIFSPNLEIFEFSDTGRGLRAKNDIAENEILFSISLDNVLSRKTVLHSLDLKAKEYVQNLKTEDLLSSYICIERNKSESFWKPYFDTLPSCSDLAQIYLADFKDILPEYVKNKIVAKNETFRASFETLKKINPNVDYKQFLEASLLGTQKILLNINKDALSKNDSISMIPFFDMFNHSPNVSVDTKVENNTFQIITKTPYKSGEQVFINYGSHDNWTLLLEYGFTISSNPMHQVRLDDILLQYLKSNKETFQFIEKIGLLNEYFVSKNEIGWRLQTVVLLTQYTHENIDLAATLPIVMNNRKTFEESFGKRVFKGSKNNGSYIEAMKISERVKVVIKKAVEIKLAQLKEKLNSIENIKYIEMVKNVYKEECSILSSILNVRDLEDIYT
ncbi:hypothetical protein O9G_003603 [Rozella allomycis CSF55]|uniref:SET domain-containing protein n=1 Tax=Rozella allomycis (strain CSF55) TaxID=988480 RepID=A0A075APE1_ROZAC|nr:hypothetical protein O9G_003603 [Rozella allomycis CSF55]|eukprot:EPZ31893.1 hypothetical protein O9G_003603 [Rozella allomycis CSF55]